MDDRPQTPGRPAAPPAGGPAARDAMPAAPPPRDRRGRAGWLRRHRVLAVLGAVVVAVLLAPAPLVDPVVERAAYGYQSECTEFSGVTVDSGTWPVVGRAAIGRLRGVSARADEVRFDSGVTIHDVDLAADEIHVAPLRFGAGGGDAEVRGGEAAATLPYSEIEEVIAGYGVTVELRPGDDALVADVQVPVIGTIPTTVELIPVDGDLELRFAALDVIPLPSVLVALPDPVALSAVDLDEDGMRLATTVDGTLASDRWGCDADTTEAPG